METKEDLTVGRYLVKKTDETYSPRQGVYEIEIAEISDTCYKIINISKYTEWMTKETFKSRYIIIEKFKSL